MKSTITVRLWVWYGVSQFCRPLHEPPCTLTKKNKTTRTMSCGKRKKMKKARTIRNNLAAKSAGKTGVMSEETLR
jgi:hypothetical protein